MAKNMNDATYRQLRVEDLDDQAFKDENDEGSGQTGPDERTVDQLVGSQRWSDVLKELIKTIPLKSNDQQIKDKACQIATKALMKFKCSDVTENVSKLTPEDADLLLHYVLRAFEKVDDVSNGNVILAFHDEIFKITGHGGLLRVLFCKYRLHPLQLA